MPTRHIPSCLALGLAALTLTACGGTGASSSGARATSASATTPEAAGSTRPASTGAGSAAPAASGAGALSAEVAATATGDIPDNQQFLTYRDRAAGYRLLYPEGWAQKGGARSVTFRDKNNLIRVVVMRRSPPSPANVTAQLAQQKAHTPTLTYGAASTLVIGGSRVVKIRYSTISSPNPVTGKRIQLLVDRYVYARSGRVAIVDLATPRGVDNVDAYRRISMSWRWT